VAAWLSETVLRGRGPGASVFESHRRGRIFSKEGTSAGPWMCVYVYQGLTVGWWKEERHSSDDSVWIKFENDQFNFVIACVYRPPTNSVLNSQNNDITLLDTIASTLEKFPNLIILGDFNFPNINWSSKTSATTSNTEQIFVDFLSENSFSQLVNEPTRYRTCQNPSLLDLILTTDENLVTSVKVSSSIEISDHSTIKFDLQLLLNPDKKIQGI
jgi:hypothetical protein